MIRFIVFCLILVCSFQQIFALPVKQDTCPTKPQNIVAMGGVITCENQATLLIGSSSTPNVVFSWMGPNGASHIGSDWTVDQGGAYMLKVTMMGDSTCFETTFISIPVDTIKPDVSVNLSAPCIDSCVSATMSSFNIATSSFWYFPNGDTLFTEMISVCESGDYKYDLLDKTNGCRSSGSVYVPNCPVFTHNNESSKLRITPMIADHQINIESPNNNVKHLMIYNLLGTLMISTDELSIDVGTLSQGQYFVNAYLDNGQMATGWFMVK